MDKLQELTDKLYQEGLAKGQQEGAALLASAREEAATIVENACKEAENLLEAARRQAEDLRGKCESDIKMASAQALQATRNDIENTLVAQMTDETVKEALSAPDFLKGIISTVAERFSSETPSDLQLVLPASLQEALEPFVKKELTQRLGRGVEAAFSRKIGGGFTIGPRDGSYFISLTDETFRSLIQAYLRPATRRFLFGE